MRMIISILVVASAMTMLAACSERPADAAGHATTQPSADEASKWIGRWTGPEGTYLEITPADGAYSIVISNLDGPRSFNGSAAGDRIDFTRDGVDESIRAGTGAQTGMKWLADKSDCLVVRNGEGYCRS